MVKVKIERTKEGGSKEILQFDKFASRQGLNSSWKREVIVKAFLKTHDHVSAQEMHEIIRRDHPAIGFTTVYRTLKLIAESGLAEVVDFDDRIRRFERKIGRDCHAHFICSLCGRSMEVFHPEIQDLTLTLAKKQKFFVQKQRMEIFGLCQRCRSKEKNNNGRKL